MEPLTIALDGDAAWGLVTGGLWAAFLVLVRVGGMMALLPLFGDMAIPARVRLALALAFAAIVTPAVEAALPEPGTAGGSVGLVMGEAAVGLAFGAVLRLFVVALQTAGTIAAQATSLSQVMGAGAGAEPSPAMAQLLVMGALALAATLGLHAKVAGYMILSYDLVPAGTAPDAGGALDWAVAAVGRSFALAFALSAPFAVLALLVNVTLGAVNRAMPALMVTVVGAPALTLGGLVLLVVAAPVMLAAWVGAFGAVLADPASVAP